MIGAGVPLTLLYNSNRFGLPLLGVKLMTLPIVNLCMLFHESLNVINEYVAIGIVQ